MKKILLLILTAASLTASAQSNIYLKSKWSIVTFNRLESYVNSAIGWEYKPANEQTIIKKSINSASFVFTGPSNRTVTVQLQKGVTGGDVDLGMAPDTIINDVYVAGFLPDLLKLYSKAFSINPNIDQLKQKGSADVLTLPDDKKKIYVAFYRGNDQTGEWVIKVRRQ